MRCTRCGAERAAGAKFCAACGARLPALCHHCGTAVRFDAKFCSGCGAPLAARRLVDARLATARGIDGLRADLIGRDEQIGQLEGALADVRGGRGQVVTIVGEAGIGKSRLVADLHARAMAGHGPPPRWLEGRCLDVSRGASYGPFLDLLRAFVGWTVEDDHVRRAERLAGVLRRLVDEGALDDGRFAELLPRIADLLSVDLGPTWPRPARLEPEPTRQRTCAALCDFLLALAHGGGLVLVLDDLHWADPLSLEVVARLTEELALAPLLLICVYRPDRERAVAHLAASAAHRCTSRYVEIQLRELTPSQSRRLVMSLLRVEDLPAPVAEMIDRIGQGNPFFVEEIVRALIDAGVLDRDGVRWRARQTIQGMAAASIQSVILSRVDLLHDDARRVLRCASVMGRVFPRRLLAHATESEAEIDRTLRDLKERALIGEGRATPEPETVFHHQLIQETIYQNLKRREREAFHGEVARAIETLHADGLEEFYELIAYHYERSGVAEKAREYLTRAGEKAAARSANLDALRYFERGLEIATDRDTREKLLGLWARSQLDLFDARPAATAFEELLTAAEQRGDRAGQLAALLGLGRAYDLLGLDDQTGAYVDRCRRAYERAHALAQRLGDTSGMTRARLALASSASQGLSPADDVA